MLDDETKDLALDVLEAAGVAQAANELVPVDGRIHDMPVSSLELTIDQLDGSSLLSRSHTMRSLHLA